MPPPSYSIVRGSGKICSTSRFYNQFANLKRNFPIDFSPGKKPSVMIKDFAFNFFAKQYLFPSKLIEYSSKYSSISFNAGLHIASSHQYAAAVFLYQHQHYWKYENLGEIHNPNVILETNSPPHTAYWR